MWRHSRPQYGNDSVRQKQDVLYASGLNRHLHVFNLNDYLYALLMSFSKACMHPGSALTMLAACQRWRRGMLGFFLSSAMACIPI